MQISLLCLCHHSPLSINFILKISQSWTKYTYEIINHIHAWNYSSEQMQFLKFNKTLSSFSNNSISTLQQKLLRVRATKMSRKYPDCLKNIVWSFIKMLSWPKWNFNLYSKYEVWPLIKIVEPMLYNKFHI